LKDYNNQKHFQLIFTGEIVLHGNDAYDITQEVISELNKRYPKTEE
jgi:Skp family chaperone for outer membrane proteins